MIDKFLFSFHWDIALVFLDILQYLFFIRNNGILEYFVYIKLENE
jgi:hypothetical protein